MTVHASLLTGSLVPVCRQLTDLSVFELAGLEYLCRLVLVRVQKLTDHAIYFLADHSKGIERLHLSYCDRLSLDALHHLIRHNKNLRRLTLTGVPAARRRGVGKFSDSPPEVRQQQSDERWSDTAMETDVAP